jgi:beta-amylase
MLIRYCKLKDVDIFIFVDVSSELIKSEILQDLCPDPEKYYHYTVPMERSKPKIPLDILLEATKAVKPYPWSEVTDMSVNEATGFFFDLLAIILSVFRRNRN